MRSNADEESARGLGTAEDHRTTRLGRFLRIIRADELPQLINVLRGDMALIGPRPKLPQYNEFLRMPYRPGITGPATLVFYREGELLRGMNERNREAFYARAIKPVKARVDMCYMCRATLISDFCILVRTVLSCMGILRHVPQAEIASWNGAEHATTGHGGLEPAPPGPEI